MASTIQRQIFEAFTTQLTAEAEKRGDDATTWDAGNVDIEYAQRTVKKILAVVLEVKVPISGDVQAVDSYALIDEKYGDYLALAMANQSLGGLADQVEEAAISPDYDDREPGADVRTFRINFAITYWHDDADARSQSNV